MPALRTEGSSVPLSAHPPFKLVERSLFTLDYSTVSASFMKNECIEFKRAEGFGRRSGVLSHTKPLVITNILNTEKKTVRLKDSGSCECLDRRLHESGLGINLKKTMCIGITEDEV